MTRYRRNQLLGLAILAASAVARLPVEERVSRDLRAAEMLPERVSAKLRDQFSQGMLLAVLGGMRSALASVLEIEAFAASHKEPIKWYEVDRLYTLCTQLQPKEQHYWTFHSWMMASNCAENYATEGTAVHGLEQQMRQFYRKRGLEIAEQGIVNLADSYQIYREAGKIVSWPNPELNPNPDHVKAADLYLRGSKCTKAPTYLYRAYAYQLALIPGREQEAYGVLKKLYDNGGYDRQPSVITNLKRLERDLNIPQAQRIPEPDRPPRPEKPPSK